MTKLLEAESVTKTFGGLTAVNAVDFDVGGDEIVGLIGPNGAGKTSFFNVISGYFRPDRGDVRLHGRSIVGLKPHRICRLGLTRTFQLVKPFPELTTRDNVMMGAFARTASPAAARERADRVLALVHLADQANVLAGNLTTAGRKRVELAKALATEPGIVLLDEVNAGLNPHEMHEMIDVIRRVRESGIAVVIVEHVMPVIMNLCDRIYVLHHGEKIAQGTPQEVADDPKVSEAYLGEDFALQE